MAKMFPEWITDGQRRSNPGFRAEFKVYDKLADSLNDDWYVFYSRTWTWVEKATKAVRTREADFIIAHKDYGIVILEVKGGNIIVENGYYVSVDGSANKWNIDPYNQVAIAVRALERRLNEEKPNPFYGYRFSSAVCFADVEIPDGFPFLDEKHRSVTIDSNQLNDLENTLINIMKDYSGEFDSPCEARIQALQALVASSWYINAPKSIQIYETENEIKKLTNNQFKLLYDLASDTPKLLVTGCAGSGKTMLAAEVARRMVQLERKKVLLTCFNKNLALWLRSSPFFVDDGFMMVANYHALCADFIYYANSSDIIKNSVGNQMDFQPNDDYPRILFEIASKVGRLFDAIIVDEGQDFLDTWWTSLMLLLNEGGQIHVYYDSQQRLTGTAGDAFMPYEITKGAKKMHLNENVRNTKNIHDTAMKFHPSLGMGYLALCDIGIEPEFVPVEPNVSEYQVASNIVNRLIQNEKVPAQEIAILTPLSLSQGDSMWKPDKTFIGPFRLVHRLHPAKDEIFCSSIRSAKGLEFPVVILTEIDSILSNNNFEEYITQLYVGISRARSHLVLLTSKEKFESKYFHGEASK